MRLTVAAIAVISLAFSLPALSCKCRDVPLDERFAEYPDVLILRTTGESRADDGSPLSKAEILESFKGAHRANETVWLDTFSHSDCMAPSAKDAKFIAFTRSDEHGHMAVSACSTIPLAADADGDALLLKLRALAAPKQSAR